MSLAVKSKRTWACRAPQPTQTPWNPPVSLHCHSSNSRRRASNYPATTRWLSDSSALAPTGSNPCGRVHLLHRRSQTPPASLPRGCSVTPFGNRPSRAPVCRRAVLRHRTGAPSPYPATPWLMLPGTERNRWFPEVSPAFSTNPWSLTWRFSFVSGTAALLSGLSLTQKKKKIPSGTG